MVLLKVLIWIIPLVFFAAGIMFLMIFPSFTKEKHKNTDWSKQTTGAWVLGVLPYWVIRLIILALGISLIYMGFGYMWNVILFPR